MREQRNEPNNAPYAQRLDLGWVIVGDVCLGAARKNFVYTGLISLKMADLLMSVYVLIISF